MTAPYPTPEQSPAPGRSAAFLVYVLYLLSIPSAAVFALIGVVVAHVTLADSAGIARAHLENQIRIWWVAFWWTVGFIVVGAVGAVLTIVLIGFPLLWMAACGAFVVMVWFTVKSVLGLLRLLDARAPWPLG